MHPKEKQFKGLTPEQKTSTKLAANGEYRRTQAHLASESLSPKTSVDKKKVVDSAMAGNKRELENFRNSGRSIKDLDRMYKTTGRTVEASGGAIARIRAGEPARYDSGK
jgi:hypothetical protein